MHKHGVLHRDISAGNIHIQPSPPDVKNSYLSLSELVSTTVGRIIDIDQANYVKERKLVPLTPVAFDTKDVGYVHRKLCVTESTATHALTVLGLDGMSYRDQAITLNVLGSRQGGQWTPADLG